MGISFTPNFNLAKFGVGDTGWGTYTDANWDTVDANLTNALPQAYLAGCQLSPTTGTPTFRVSITKGQAQDAGNAGAMTLAATLIKDISSAWAVGSGNGGLALPLVLTASTWYHLFLIKRTDTNVVDAYFDTSVTAANIPAPYTLFRRLGSVKTDGGTKLIQQFVQDGDYFRWLVSVLDVNDTAWGTTTFKTKTLSSVPTGVNVLALGNLSVQPTAGAASFFLVSDFAANDEAPSGSAAPLATLWSVASGAATEQVIVRTNTSGQVRMRNNQANNDTINWATIGWFDSRGKNG